MGRKTRAKNNVCPFYVVVSSFFLKTWWSTLITIYSSLLFQKLSQTHQGFLLRPLFFMYKVYTLNFFPTNDDMYLKYIKVNNLLKLTPSVGYFSLLLHLFFWLFDQFCQQAPGHHVSGLHKTETVVESSGSACHRLLFITSPTPPTSFSNQHPLRFLS